MDNRRRAPRHDVHCPVAFVVEDVEGAGTVYNLSERGCAISTPVPVPSQGYASAAITLPDQPEPVQVELARVCWSTRTEFGLEFRILGRQARKRLMQFLFGAKAA